MINKLLTGFSVAILFSITASAQTLFTYGTKPVSQSEFVSAFEKNPAPGNKRKAMEEYLPLFINYKLKVQDALDKKMDTLANQKSELENYHSQLVENFINTKANTNALVKEAFERSQKDILLGHLFIGFDPKDSAGIQSAGRMAEKAKAALDAKQDFATVVKQYSTDEANKASGGRAGWITAFSIPYLFETAVYDLQPGAYSSVMKSAGGFHIFKKMAERPAAGTVKVAQIMLINPEPGNEIIEAKNKKLSDSLHTLLQKGASFDTLAMEFSNDRTSYDNGGVLPEFGVGTYAGLFEEQAFALTSKGAISKPFATEFGWHILKLLDKKRIPASLDDADFSTAISQKVTASGRAAAAREVYLKSELKKLGFKPAPVNQTALWQFTDSAITTGNIKGQKITAKTSLFTIGNMPATAGQWLQFVKSAKLSPGGESKNYNELFEAFTMVSTENYLHKNLEKIEPSFAQQYKEFKDANLLFEAMDNNVWNKASVDTAGLLSYYNQHKNKYHWGPSASAVMITCTDSSIVNDVRNAVIKNPSAWRQLNDTYAAGIIVDSGRYELSQLPVGTNTNAADLAGTVTATIKNELDASQTFACIFKVLPGNEQRSFDDARGFVINDYQQVLEERWLATLKKKYPVKVNPTAWSKLLASM